MRTILSWLLLSLLGVTGLYAAQQHPTMSSAMADCADTGGNHLNYTAAAGMSCGTSGAGSLPAGIIVFTAGACPATWTEYAAAQGFAVVGLVAGGTAAGTVGTALTNLQDKTHAHTYTDVVNHTHPENVPSSASGGALKIALDTNASGAQDSGSVTANPTGGVATGTTATKATSDVISYIQLRACSKD